MIQYKKPINKTMNKIFAIYYEHNINKLGQLYPHKKDRQFNEAIFDLYNKLSKKGINLIVINQQNIYVGNGQFFGFWEPCDNYRFKKINKLIKPALIFDKGHIDFNDGFLAFFNNHDFARLGRNKYTQSVIAEKFVPCTQLVCSEKDYTKVLKKIRTEKIVAKPLDKNGGNGVALYNRDNIYDNQTFPVIMQEFIESEGGIDGMISGRHDIRLYIVDGNVAMCSIRQPAKGNWLSNTHQGGSIRFYRKSQINSELLKFAKPIIEKFDNMGGKFYSIDFMCSGNNWYMVEMNDRPGMPALCQNSNGAVEEFYNRLVEMIIKEIA